MGKPEQEYAPPPGPPPSYQTDYPSNSTPSDAPPGIPHDFSPATNASKDESDRAAAWCRQRPLAKPIPLTQAQLAAVQPASSIVDLIQPPTFQGDFGHGASQAQYRVRTPANHPDVSLLSSLPLYSALADSPLATECVKTVYFEIRVLRIPANKKSKFSASSLFRKSKAKDAGDSAPTVASLADPQADASISLGFVAAPFPTFRQPGWQRGSLAVHGDDGRRFVNNTFGGDEFTKPFRAGQTLGIGMRFSPPPPSYSAGAAAQQAEVEVFFTRDGKLDNKWDGRMAMDSRSEGGAVGLLGDSDLFAAVGFYGGIEAEISFCSHDWKYVPKSLQ